MWNHRNNISFNLVIIGHALKTYHKMMFCTKQTNTFMQDNDVGTTQRNRNSRTVRHRWTSLVPIGINEIWMHQELFQKCITISYACRDNRSEIL